MVKSIARAVLKSSYKINKL